MWSIAPVSILHTGPMPKRVKIVLNEDVLNLGKNGDLVEVAPGYARNFLLPFGKACLLYTSPSPRDRG